MKINETIVVLVFFLVFHVSAGHACILLNDFWELSVEHGVASS